MVREKGMGSCTDKSRKKEGLHQIRDSPRGRSRWSAGSVKAEKSGRNVTDHQRKMRGPCGRTVRQDYTRYRFSAKEWIACAGIYAGLDAAVSYLFFDSVIAFLVLAPGFALFQREYRRELKQRREKEMRREFLDGMQMTAASLQAGYSLENAFCESLKELRKIYSPDAFIMREFHLLASQVDMNRNVEELLSDLGKRSGIDDIRSLAEVVETAKRAGGDLIQIIRNTISCMRQRQETAAEIETCLAGKMMEQNVMSLVPILILAYVRLSSPEFLESMYGNLTGISVMGICFLVYVAAVFWGRSITDIEV